MQTLSIILQLHTPEELVLYSNIGHWMEGGLFLIVAGIAFIQALGYWRSQKALYLWPIIILVSGLSLPFFAFAHHINGELALAWKATISDPQQRQHMIMAILVALAGIAEVAYLRSQAKHLVLRFMFPIALGIIGVMFIIHPQHGTSEAVLKAVIIHKYLGTVLIVSAVFRPVDVITKQTRKWITFVWVLFLVAAAVLLISYREPQGAYQIETHNMSQMQYGSEHSNKLDN